MVCYSCDIKKIKLSAKGNEMKKIICHDIHGNKKEVATNLLSFRPSVYGILIQNNKVLLSKQWDGYDFPGGGINLDERIDEALEREFFEETGINIKPIRPLYCATSFFNPNYASKYTGQYWNCPLLYFIVEQIGGNLSKDNLDNNELLYADLPEWINLENIPNIRFYNAIDSTDLIKKAVKEQNKC